MMPEKFDSTPQAKLWRAEQMICETMPNLVSYDNPQETLTNAVSAYVGKWSPYKERELMKIYIDA